MRLFQNKPSEADVIIRRIKNNEPAFTHAYFDYIHLSTKQVNSLVKAIKQNTHLTYINLFDCNLTKNHLQLLLPAFSSNQTIEKIIINQDIDRMLYTQIMDCIGENLTESKTEDKSDSSQSLNQ